MKAQHMLDYTIKSALEWLDGYLPGANSKASQQMMLYIAAIESSCGIHMKQIKGPAEGPWQIEPDTHDDLYDSFIKFRPDLLEAIQHIRGEIKNPVINNMFYSCVMARIVLYRYPEPMPEFDDIHGMYAFYKKRFNSADGASTTSKWLTSIDFHCKGVDFG